MTSVGFEPTLIVLTAGSYNERRLWPYGGGIMARIATGLPPAIARRRNAVLRPRDAAEVYSHPRSELSRLARRGLLRRLATGYYAVVPQRRLGDQRWRPDLHAAALGVAQADYGIDAVALMGTSAARHHGAIPREVAVAVVAIPTQRAALQLEDGKVVFVKRRVEHLDVERIDTELVTGWVTTVEQTLLDILARPTLGGMTPVATEEAARALAARADWDRVAILAQRQRKTGVLRAAEQLLERTHASA